MRKVFFSLLLCFLVLYTTQSFASNIAYGATVSLSGDFFNDPTNIYGGSPASQALIDSIVDGLFLEEQKKWNLDSLWWIEWTGQSQRTVTIDLGGLFAINSFIVQADNNDTYRLSYLNGTTLEWTDIMPVPGYGSMTRPEIFLSAPIVTSQISISATGDRGYSISEIQAFGSPVPEPATLLLLGFGLLGVAGVSRRKN